MPSLMPFLPARAFDESGSAAAPTPTLTPAAAKPVAAKKLLRGSFMLRKCGCVLVKTVNGSADFAKHNQTHPFTAEQEKPLPNPIPVRYSCWAMHFEPH